MNLRGGNPLSYVSSCLSSIGLPTFTKCDIIHVIASLNNSSAGHDNISAFMVKKTIDVYISPLTYLINQSLENGSFPDELKIAKVIPLFKSGDCFETRNYRPISVYLFFKNIRKTCI